MSAQDISHEGPKLAEDEDNSSGNNSSSVYNDILMELGKLKSND
jgi:hypothetical protein